MNRALCYLLLGFLAIIVLVSAWTVAASFLFVWMGGLQAFFPLPLTTWWLYALSGSHDKVTRINLLLSFWGAAIPITILAGIPIRLLYRRGKLSRPFGGGLRKSEQGVTENHGRAAWPTVAEMKKRFRGLHDEWGGVVVAEARRVDLERVANVPFLSKDPSTWGEGGKADLLIDPCDEDSGSGHSLVFAGSGSNKTQAAASTQFHFRGPLICFDPAAELGPMMREFREEEMGHRVIFVGYGKDCTPINVLSCIHPERPGASARVLSMTASLCGEEKERGENGVFRDAGKNLVACLMAHMMWDDSLPENQKTIENLIDGMTIPETRMKDCLRSIHAMSKSPLARRLAGTLMDIYQETFSGAYFNSSQMLAYLFDPENAHLLSGSLKPEEILHGGLDVYIQIPVETLQHAPGVGRVLVDSFVSAIIQANGEFADRMLLQVDEAKFVENMKSLETILRWGRKFGLIMQLIYTSADDMENVWGEKPFLTWLNGVSWAGYAAVASRKTQEYLSKEASTRGVLAYSEGENRGFSGGHGRNSKSKGSNENVHEISQPLIRPEDFRECRTDEIFVVTRTGRMIRAGMPISYRRKEMVAKIQRSKFHKPRRVA